jgi:hypothetical protein
MKPPFFLMGVGICLCLVGCYKGNDAELKQLHEKVGALTEKINSLIITQADFEADARIRFSLLEEGDQKDGYYKLDTERVSYALCHTYQGELFVCTKSPRPYLDGYKVTLKIGNPTSAIFHGLEVAQAWGNAATNLPSFVLAHGSTNHFTDSLKAGYWNDIDLVFAPCSAEELRNAAVWIRPREVSLHSASQ